LQFQQFSFDDHQQQPPEICLSSSQEGLLGFQWISPIMNKESLIERDICTNFITPSLKAAGWDLDTQIREEVGFTDGRIYVRGKIHARGAKKRVDYILYYKPNIPRAKEYAIRWLPTRCRFLPELRSEIWQHPERPEQAQAHGNRPLPVHTRSIRRGWRRRPLNFSRMALRREPDFILRPDGGINQPGRFGREFVATIVEAIHRAGLWNEGGKTGGGGEDGNEGVFFRALPDPGAG
jgi:hypothetical protein